VSVVDAAAGAAPILVRSTAIGMYEVLPGSGLKAIEHVFEVDEQPCEILRPFVHHL
jgi:hypothetical protein